MHHYIKFLVSKLVENPKTCKYKPPGLMTHTAVFKIAEARC